MKKFEMRIKGKGVSPATVSARELLRLVLAMEDAIRFLAEGEAGEAFVAHGGFSLVKIRKGSAAALLSSPKLEAVEPYFIQIARCGGRPEMLPEVPGQKMGKVIDFCERRGAKIELRTDPASKSPVGVIASSRHASCTDDIMIKGSTTLYGKILQVGGGKPKAKLRLLDGNVLNCTVPKKLAKAMGGKLYEEIGVRGEATWNVSTKSIVKFDIEELMDYEGTALDVAVAAIQSTYGDCFDDIVDINAFLDSVRR